MFYKICATVLVTVVCRLKIIHGGSPKYTWPLFSGNPLLEIIHDVVEGKQGCSLKSGNVHSTLGYGGIYVTGSTNSHVDVPIDDSTEFKDFSITIYINAKSAMGAGTIFHYTQDDSAAIDPIFIKDVILWNNATHLVVETLGQNNEVYSSITAEFNVSSTVQNWVGIGFSQPHDKKVKLITDTGVSIEMDTLHHTNMGQPGTLRFGASFDNSRQPFHGNLICANLYDTKDCKLSDSIAECTAGDWQQNAVEPFPTDTCGELKGYFKVIQRDSAIDTSVAALDSMTTASKVKCADLCLRTELCWTFTLDKNLGFCKIYDADYSSNILPATGCNYYLRRDICC